MQHMRTYTEQAIPHGTDYNNGVRLMALSIWSQPSGYSLGTFPEQVTVGIPLPLFGDVTDVTFNVIS